ncbi:hypothetical protein, partial [Cellulomonas algicola]|uniref:hypothetical protein n=1 Tax=Cellulomonas algicola TaxID=2071633 RepID=UPI001B3546D9
MTDLTQALDSHRWRPPSARLHHLSTETARGGSTVALGVLTRCVVDSVDGALAADAEVGSVQVVVLEP